VPEQRGTDSQKMTLNLDDIHQALLQQLPDYMVPAHLVCIDILPLSANGKVDRKQIQNQLKNVCKTDTNYEKPKTQLEQQVADVWGEVLKLEKISLYDDFFQIGGDSLTATHIVQLLQKRRISPADISLILLFSAPTVEKLAEEIKTQWQALGVSDACDETNFEEGTI
jgi:acyl carrier protein